MTAKAKLETSKRIVLVVGVIWCAHVTISCALILVGCGEGAVSLMSACMPVYLAVAAGYFGKAGVENVTKIKRLADELSDAEVESSNG